MKKYDVIIVGSGAAGFASALYLHSFDVRNICIVTENVKSGTSRNTGSDKQTYYKTDLCSGSGDSVYKMAEDMASGGSMNGSDALIEASNSVRCFMNLVSLGVEFPTDSYGNFVGYKTDHDSTARATSAGPLTSKYMTEALEKKVRENKTEILDGYTVIKLISSDNVCLGVLCLTENGTVPLYSKCVILATGAPAGVYANTVYPVSQTGATGLAIEAGAELSNFQEWQYGIASVKFRWNLSGSYQQVVPGYVSVDENGEEREFLIAGRDRHEMYSKVFLKGYQWPFDSKKTDGSSQVDMLVFEELQKGRRVFLDYTENPEGFDFSLLSNEAKKYLTDTDSIAPSPIERLTRLNPKAVKLYLDNGIDLTKERLEISLCAQHNNGGIRTDINSQSSVKNLFAVGEAAGKFGVYRPGGSALNDTQVSALRAAEYISRVIPDIDFSGEKQEHIEPPVISEKPTLPDIMENYRERMSGCAGTFRDVHKLITLRDELKKLDENYHSLVTAAEGKEKDYYLFRLTVKSMLSLCVTEISSAENIGSRGGCLCLENGKIIEENSEYRKYITVTRGDGVKYIPTDEIPRERAVFEKLLKG